MRTSDVATDGNVLPIAWNMLPVTKITPDATKLHDTMRRYSSPTAIAPASLVNARMRFAGTMWQSAKKSSNACVNRGLKGLTFLGVS